MYCTMDVPLLYYFDAATALQHTVHKFIVLLQGAVGQICHCMQTFHINVAMRTCITNA